MQLSSYSTSMTRGKMKEIKVLIRFSDDKVGFAIDKDKDTDEKLPDILQFIGALDLLKQQQLNKVIKKFEAKGDKNAFPEF